MRIRCGYRLRYACSAPTPMMLMLSVRPEREVDLRTSQKLTVDPSVPVRRYIDGFGNACHRLVAPVGELTLSADFEIEDSGALDPVTRDAIQHPVEDLPDAVLIYLLGSRYCETDRLLQTAWSLFGGAGQGWALVQAIVDYAHTQVTFNYAHARPTRTAMEAHEERVGVCRDYAHLAITLCRCMNIPARYCTGYLGDIGVPVMDAPMDFSAWFQVFLGRAWHTFDARHNQPRIGRILMAHGRDATDVAITTNFGRAHLLGFEVITEELAA